MIDAGQDDPARRAERALRPAAGDARDRDGERPRAAGRAARDDVLNNPEMADLYFGGSVRTRRATRPHDAVATRRERRCGRGVGHRVRALPEPQPSRACATSRTRTSRRSCRSRSPRPRCSRRRRRAGDLGDLATPPRGRSPPSRGAGVLHFLLGWTFLNLSQQRIGAARTSPAADDVAACSRSRSPRSPSASCPSAVDAGRRSRRWCSARYVVVSRGGGARRAARRRAARRSACALMWGAQPGAHRRGPRRARRRRCSA